MAVLEQQPWIVSQCWAVRVDERALLPSVVTVALEGRISRPAVGTAVFERLAYSSGVGEPYDFEMLKPATRTYSRRDLRRVAYGQINDGSRKLEWSTG